MSYILSAVSDCGFRHSVNQDSVLVRKLQSAHGEMVFACICDGMGGLQYGELASATLVSCFDDWLDTDLPEILSRSDCEEELRSRWQALIDRAGNLMRTFAEQTGATLGTTLSALLLWQNRGFIANIGDTRVYEIGKTVQILTRDHTFVREEIDAGRMTPEQAACSGKEHILTRCVGVREDANADFYRITGKKKTLYLLCSDGFRHKISPEEMHEQLSGKTTAAALESAHSFCAVANAAKKTTFRWSRFWQTAPRKDFFRGFSGKKRRPSMQAAYRQSKKSFSPIPRIFSTKIRTTIRCRNIRQCLKTAFCVSV